MSDYFDAQRALGKVDGTYPVDADGFRVSGSWFHGPDEHVIASEVPANQSLAVLGEPGVGKSTTIQQIVASRGAAWVELDEAGTPETFSTLLETAAVNVEESPTPVVVIDGLDECPLPPKTLIRRLRQFLTATDMPIIIGGRSASWTVELEAMLGEVRSDFRTYELLPLSLTDIAAAAEHRGLSSADFQRALREVGAAALAMRPLTLTMLLEAFAATGTLPERPAELFARGVLHLADEHDKLRTPGTWANEHYVAVAERVSASLLVAGAATVTTGPPTGMEPSSGSLSAGYENVESGKFDVTVDLVMETFRTGLFHRRGPGRFAVSHVTFASFLAARYLIRRRLSVEQVRSLFVRGNSIARPGLSSHLRETAAWLVSLAPEQFAWLIEIDPEGFLAHTSYLRDDPVREVLVDRLLGDRDLAEATRWVRYRLAHPTLVAQLRTALTAPLTTDAGEDFSHPVSFMASTAIDIARDSQAIGVAPMLAGLVAAPHLNPYLRSKAARALIDLAPELAGPTLRPLLDELEIHPERDPQDDLRGLTLRACHSDLTGAELATFLTRPRSMTVIGPYRLLLREIGKNLTLHQIADLVAAARAAEAAQPDASATGAGASSPAADAASAPAMKANGILDLLSAPRREDLRNQLIGRLLTDPAGYVDTNLAHAAWLVAKGLSVHRPVSVPQELLLSEAPLVDPDTGVPLRRRLGVAVALALPAQRRARATALVGGIDSRTFEPALASRRLLGTDDFEWLLTADLGGNDELRRTLTRATYDPEDPAHVQLAWDNKSKAGLAWATPWFEPVPLDGEDAKLEKEFALEERAVRLGTQAHAARLSEAWEAVQAGDTAAVATVVAALRIDPSGGWVDHFRREPMAQWPGMQASGIDLGELALACIGHLHTASAPPGEWREDVTRFSETGNDLYAMLRLIAETMPESEVSGALPGESWEALAPVIIRFPMSPYTADDSPDAVLVRVLREVVPDQFRTGYLERIRHSLEQGATTLPPLWPLQPIYNADVEAVLIEAAHSVATRLREVQTEIESLDPSPTSGTAEAQKLANKRQAEQSLAHSLGNVLELASTSVSAVEELRALMGPEFHSRVQSVTAYMLLIAGRVAWHEVWDQFATDEVVIRAFVEQLTLGANYAPAGHLLDMPAEADLVKLWDWIESALPPDQRREDGVGRTGRLRDLQGDVLTRLSVRGTHAALEALADLEARHPGIYAIRSRRRVAEESYRDAVWEGTRVHDFMRLVADASLRVVHDEESLFNVVRGLFATLSDRLERGMGDLLWNEQPPDVPGKPATYRPKNEAQIQTIIADHLRSELGRGLVVNREVQVRTTSAKGHGLSVDVLVTGGQADEGKALSQCPIEVKGNWNAKLLTDLRDQLVNDYMQDVHATYGFYVCGWFDKAQWTDVADGRRAKTTKTPKPRADKLEEAAWKARKDRGVHVEVVFLPIPRSVPSDRAD